MASRALRVLCLVADRPTLGADRILRELAAVFAAVPGERVLVIDRGRGGDGERLAHVSRLVDLCHGAGAALMVSARCDLALAAGADGVHLPERALDPGLARAAWPGLLIGRSCHDRPGLEAAEAAGADYALLSPVAPPHSKPAENVLGVAGFAAAVAGLGLPVLALGGVTEALAPALRAAGAYGVATLGGVLGTPDPGARARGLLAAWDSGAS